MLNNVLVVYLHYITFEPHKHAILRNVSLIIIFINGIDRKMLQYLPNKYIPYGLNIFDEVGNCSFKLLSIAFQVEKIYAEAIICFKFRQ